jgi:hypothetical protein
MTPRIDCRVSITFSGHVLLLDQRHKRVELRAKHSIDADSNDPHIIGS